MKTDKDNYKTLCEEWGMIKYDPIRGYLFERRPYNTSTPQSLISVLLPYLDKCEGKEVIITIDWLGDER